MLLVDHTAYFEILSKKNFKKDPDLIERLKADGFPASTVAFYQTMNGFQLKWRFKGDLLGGVDFLPAEHLFDQTRQDLEQPGTDWFIDDRAVKLEGFYHPIEYLTDEASVGFLSSSNSGELFYYDSGAVFYSLNIDLVAYCSLIDFTYGLALWPRLLLGLRNIAFQESVEAFVKEIERVNPAFDRAAFEAAYKERQLS